MRMHSQIEYLLNIFCPWDRETQGILLGSEGKLTVMAGTSGPQGFPMGFPGFPQRTMGQEGLEKLTEMAGTPGISHGIP